MTQAQKKSPAQAGAKIASEAANKAAKSTLDAVEHGRHSAENVIKLGSKAVKDFMSTSADEAQKAQDKVFALSREGAENLTKSADAVTKMLHESVSMGRDGFDTALECGNMAAALVKDLSKEVFESTNKSFSESVEMSKQALACRTISDMMELQNRLVKSSIDNFFNQSVKLSGMVFEYTQEALEPINERVAEAGNKMSKILSV